MQLGFFSIDDAHTIEKMPLEEAKNYCLSKIRAQPNARSNNVNKATLAVNKATTVANLMLTIANFTLAHPSENLKSIS